jgi:Leucine-rich repeat (LRR) protein
LSGVIPAELGDLTTLEDLFLYNNLLTGSIPPELGDLTVLRFLYLNDNQLTGSIPPELGRLAGLQRLLLDSNRLSGRIPPELGDLGVLLFTYLDDNALVGPVPVDLMDLTSLLDDTSDFCNNHLFTSDSALSSFLDTKQIGGDWESCQTAPVPAVPNAGMLVLLVLLAGSALWAVGRTETTAG